ncbi:MAG: hypothetical protein ACRCYQ_00960, partial [Nocardioides sp.]
ASAPAPPSATSCPSWPTPWPAASSSPPHGRADHAIRREIRRRAAQRDAQIYAASIDPDLESDTYRAWAARNAGEVSSELE